MYGVRLCSDCSLMRALVIGGARSGLGVARLLHSKGYTVTLATNQDFDERESLQNLGIIVNLNDRDMSLVTNYDIVVKNPGIPNDHPLVSKFNNVVNEIEVASMFSKDYHYYAISGTNGKTTTTTLLWEMLKRKNDHALLAGNVGFALSEAVFRDGNDKRDVALEISAFQMEGTPTFNPEVYALINLSPDHLDRYINEEAYYQAKLKILDRVKVFVRNVEDSNIVKLTQDYKGQCIDVSLHDTSKDVFIQNDSIYYRDVELFKISSLKLVGEHNLLNASIASVVAYLAGVNIKDIQIVIDSFKGVEHRIEFVRELHGVRYYNDSKATNPESTEVALKSFPDSIVLLLGGYDKHISFDILKPYMNRVKKLYVYGESAEQLKTTFPQAIRVETMFEALSHAEDELEEGDVVLLSPACASYDQFNNFEERGNLFKEAVNKLQ